MKVYVLTRKLGELSGYWEAWRVSSTIEGAIKGASLHLTLDPDKLKEEDFLCIRSEISPGFDQWEYPPNNPTVVISTHELDDIS